MKTKYKSWKERCFSDKGYLYISSHDYPYVKGIVGADIKLTWWQKFLLLFCNGISVVFIGRK